MDREMKWMLRGAQAGAIAAIALGLWMIWIRVQTVPALLFSKEFSGGVAWVMVAAAALAALSFTFASVIDDDRWLRNLVRHAGAQLTVSTALFGIPLFVLAIARLFASLPGETQEPNVIGAAILAASGLPAILMGYRGVLNLLTSSLFLLGTRDRNANP